MTITLNGTTGITTPALDSDGTLIADGLTIAGATSLTGNLSVDGGTIKLDGNYPVGTANVALGANALGSNISGQSLTAIGHSALYNNVAIQNTAVGYQAGFTNSTGVELTAVGYWAGFGNTSGASNTSFGWGALKTNTTGSSNHAFGSGALYQNINGNDNIAIGVNAMGSNQSGSNNVGIGRSALVANTTASDSTAVGYQAGYSTTTGGSNTYIGKNAGYNATTGIGNCFVGGGWATSGYSMTTGSKNTILGGFSGNGGGLDIRTSSNNIVLSDGDGNPRVWINNSGYIHSLPTYNNTTGSGANLHVESSGQFVRSTSSLRYKNTVNDATHGLTELLALRPVTYKGNNDGDTIFGGLIAEEVHDAGLTEFVQYNDDGEPDALAYGNMVSLCIKAIQELSAKNDALTARITALEGN
jgi:trimeric autotransporter adhesin